MKPLIGITMNLLKEPARKLNSLDQDYVSAVLQAGGFPVPILSINQSIAELVKRLDGFLFTGGDDIPPRYYRQKPMSGVTLRLAEDDRVRFEMKLLKAVIESKKPILAVCYGAQLVNVALGGTLYQDIALEVPKTMKHGASKAGEKVFHVVNVFEGTKLCHILGKGDCRTTGNCSIKVRSAHHQGFKNPGRGLRLSAASPDGVFEALESRGKQFLIAVQWHPEKNPADQATKKLFSSFIAAARS